MTENTQERPAAKLAFWQKALLVSAVVVGVAGVGLAFYAAGGDPAASGSRASDALRTGLSAGAVSEGETVRDTARDYGPLLWQGALAFVLAFCVGMALRKSLRFAAVVAGFGILVVVGLQFGGVYEVDWEGVRAGAREAAEKVDVQSDGALEWISRHIASAVAGALGAITGFIRA